MLRSLVGSEMCIRDSGEGAPAEAQDGLGAAVAKDPEPGHARLPERVLGTRHMPPGKRINVRENMGNCCFYYYYYYYYY